MVDEPITDLTALTGGSQAAGDLIELVDISDLTFGANGTNKKMTLTDFFTSVPVAVSLSSTLSASGGINSTTIGLITTANGQFTAVGVGMAPGGSGTLSVSGTLSAAQTSITTADASAIPTIVLTQNDVSEEMMEFSSTIGTGNAIEAIGAKTLTTTHFIKVTLPGGLTRYIPAGTIA